MVIEEQSAEVVQLGARRAKRTGDAESWTPKDALLEMLRMVDAGLVIDNLLICYDGIGGAGFQNATHHLNDALALLVVTQWELISAGKQ